MQANAKWALTVNPNNKALQQRQQKIKDLRAKVLHVERVQ